MVVHPLESAGTRRRSVRSMVPSIAFHAGVVFLAVRATANAALAPATSPQESPLVQFAPPPSARSAPARGSSRARPNPRLPRTDIPVVSFTVGQIPPALPTQSQGLPTVDEFRSGALPPAGAGRPGEVGTTSVLRGDEVDRQVEPLGGGPRPDYPDALRAASVGGTVVAEFVVDSSGRPEPASFRAIRADDPRFVTAVRAAVLRARFRPAEAAGKHVRQLVQEPFTFAIR